MKNPVHKFQFSSLAGFGICLGRDRVCLKGSSVVFIFTRKIETNGDFLATLAIFQVNSKRLNKGHMSTLGVRYHAAEISS